MSAENPVGIDNKSDKTTQPHQFGGIRVVTAAVLGAAGLMGAALLEKFHGSEPTPPPAPTASPTVKPQPTLSEHLGTGVIVESTARPVVEPSPAVTSVPSTERPLPTPTQEILVTNPEIIQAGELTRYFNPGSTEQLIQASKEQHKPFVPLKFENPASVRMERIDTPRGILYKVIFSGKLTFMAPNSGKIVNFMDYDPAKTSAPLIVYENETDAAKLPPPPSGFSVHYSVYGSIPLENGANGARQELGFTVVKGAKITYLKKVGDMATEGEDLATVSDIPADNPPGNPNPDPANCIRFSLSSTTGSYMTNFENFAHIGNKPGMIAAPGGK